VDGLPERAVERPAGGRPLEARQAPARVGTPSGARSGNEIAVLGVEPLELPLRRLAAAAGARADRYAAPSDSIGTPAFGSSSTC